MYSKKEMNIWYKKILNNHFSFPYDLSEKILLIINKESVKWELIKNNILKTIICKKNYTKLKWNNPIVCLWSDNDFIDDGNWINDWNWFNSIE